jgi:N-acetylmuramoyl-L-alanine amidase
MRIILPLLVAVSFATVSRGAPPGSGVARTGDEIVVCGQFFHTGTKVVLWIDPGGYDAYRLESRFPFPELDRKTRGPIYGSRIAQLTDAETEQTRGGNWTLDDLRKNVDQFVLHYDVAGVSQECFKVLFSRGLSVHFMCDIDGTIYQTLDLKDAAWHATIANGRSVGVEIANMGGYSSPVLLSQWYAKSSDGKKVSIMLPERIGDGGVLTPHFVGHPIRSTLVHGLIQGKPYEQYDFTPQQYEALSHLTATLCTVFPKIQCDYPRQKSALGPPTDAPATQPVAGDPTTRPSALASFEERGALIPHKLTYDQWDDYQGVIGHYHIQLDKQDPGPAMQWDLLINNARALMTPEALKNNVKHRHQPARTIPTTQPTTPPMPTTPQRH